MPEYVFILKRGMLGESMADLLSRAAAPAHVLNELERLGYATSAGSTDKRPDGTVVTRVFTDRPVDGATIDDIGARYGRLEPVEPVQ